LPLNTIPEEELIENAKNYKSAQFLSSKREKEKQGYVSLNKKSEEKYLSNNL